MKPASTNAHRSDIDALRAVAVGLVVLFHMSFPGFDSGFIGVDIFFVLSGFLITGVLARELETTGKIDLLNFWSRRIRRLLPAGLFVVISVLVFARVFGSPLSWEETSGTATSAVLYYSNFYFVAGASDYFGSDTETNPLLHFWSLSVEEQYYVVWPLLFAAVGVLISRFKQLQHRRSLLGLISAVIAISFIHSYVLSANGSANAYYLTTSRAWEFAVGAFLAVYLQGKQHDVSTSTRTIAAIGGLGLLGLCLIIIDFAPFPAPSGILPVFGTILFVWAAVPEESGFGRLLALGPIQYVGRLSYSWYLWHWPFLVLGQQFFLSKSAPTRVLLVAASFVAAIVTHHGLENPLRYSPLIKSRARSYAFAGASILIGVGGALLLNSAGDRKLAEPELAALQELRDPWYAEATKDFGCAISDIDDLNDRCTFGATESATRLLILGDSNAQQWLPAFHLLGLEHDFAVTLRVRGGCPGPAVVSNITIDPDKCAALQQETAQMVEMLEPDAVVVSQASFYAELMIDSSGRLVPGDQRQPVWIEKTGDLLDSLNGLPVGWITPISTVGFDPVECLSMRDAQDCENPRDEAIRLARQQGNWTTKALDTAANRPVTFDPIPHLCSDTECALKIDGTFVYRDHNHLSVPMVEKLMPELEELLGQLSILS